MKLNSKVVKLIIKVFHKKRETEGIDEVQGLIQSAFDIFKP